MPRPAQQIELKPGVESRLPTREELDCLCDDHRRAHAGNEGDGRFKALVLRFVRHCPDHSVPDDRADLLAHVGTERVLFLWRGGPHVIVRHQIIKLPNS